MPKKTASNRDEVLPKKTQSGLSSLREAAGLTQLELAVLIGVTPNTIQGWEKNGLPHLRKYQKLATILDCELDDLGHGDNKEELFSEEDLKALSMKMRQSS